MDENKLFKKTGAYSKAGYLQQVKANPEQRGFTWLRKTGYPGAPGAVEVKAIFELLVNQRYIERFGKPDWRGSTYYRVTSLGHRYIEEHKDELEVKELIGKKYEVTDSKDSSYTHEDFLEPHKKQKLEPLNAIPKPTDEPDTKKGATMSAAEDEALGRSVLGDKKVDDMKRQLLPDPDGNAPGDYFDRRTRASLRSMIGDALIEKFGDQMTVKELVEYVEKQKPAAQIVEDEAAW